MNGLPMTNERVGGAKRSLRLFAVTLTVMRNDPLLIIDMFAYDHGGTAAK
jgi:hypothetical protein